MSTRQTRSADGVLLSYRVEGRGEPLVLVHGLSDEKETFSPLVERLSPHFTCVSLDLRGHGASAQASDYSPEALVGDLNAVIEEEGLSAPALVGHSLGGLLVTLYAAEHPARAVLNLDQPLDMGRIAQKTRSLKEALQGPEFPQLMLSLMGEEGMDRLNPPLREELYSHRSIEQRPVVLGIWDFLFTRTEEELDAWIEDKLRRLCAPYLSLQGMDFGKAHTEWLCGLMPGAEVEIWEGLGHYLHLIEQERFAARVCSFLRR